MDKQNNKSGTVKDAAAQVSDRQKLPDDSKMEEAVDKAKASATPARSSAPSHAGQEVNEADLDKDIAKLEPRRPG